MSGVKVFCHSSKGAPGGAVKCDSLWCKISRCKHFRCQKKWIVSVVLCDRWRWETSPHGRKVAFDEVPCGARWRSVKKMTQKLDGVFLNFELTACCVWVWIWQPKISETFRVDWPIQIGGQTSRVLGVCSLRRHLVDPTLWHKNWNPSKLVKSLCEKSFETEGVGPARCWPSKIVLWRREEKIVTNLAAWKTVKRAV